ncbi:MAG: PAS domain-containing protein [Proteobacteria bacterium]|nr:PAS domain-containing protein [Pseudomonadota bacterium]
MPDTERAIEVERLYAIAPVGLCYFDTQLRYRYINEWLARLHAISVEEHLGKTFEEVLGDAAPGIAPHIHQVIDTGVPFAA